MTFENEFFEMAQALEENSDMLNIQHKLSDSQVNESFIIIFKIDFYSKIETCFITFNKQYSII
jgi:hypothetical protein